MDISVAALCEPASCAAHGVSKADLRPGDNVVIVGCGPIGALALQTARLFSPAKLILVEIDECYTQCSKALIRSDLWNPDQHVERSELPSSGKILRAVREEEEFDANEYDRARAERYARREGLY